MSEITKDMMKVKPMDLDINGMKTETDVCNMICDTIDDGNLSDAMDYVGQFKDYLVKKESAIQQQDPRHNQYGSLYTQ